MVTEAIRTNHWVIPNDLLIKKDCRPIHAWDLWPGYLTGMILNT